MVFVTVGTPTQGFSRLLEAVDALAGREFFGGEAVFAQTGFTRNFQPRHCDWQPFIQRDVFERYLREASLIVCHGGVTLLDMVRLGKVPVVMPRRRKYGEHVNDHQLELVDTLASEGRVVAAHEPEDLPSAISDARRRVAQPIVTARMIGLVGDAIKELLSGPARQA